jgi:hypothetical protein
LFILNPLKPGKKRKTIDDSGACFQETQMKMKQSNLFPIYILAVSMLLPLSDFSAQGLFEKAEETLNPRKLSFELNGYLRSTLFAGKTPEANKAEIKSGYGEAAIKLKVRKKNFGDAFAEIRFRQGSEWNQAVSEAVLREAYLNLYLGPFDFRIGHQIVVWGRADGFNPTDNITPQNGLVRSANEDDRRVANFLIRSFLNIKPFRLEAIWVPFFRFSVIPTDFFPLPENISLEPDYPLTSLDNGSIALKLNLEIASFDASISYFNGFNPVPGLCFDITGMPGTSSAADPGTDILSFLLKPYRMHIFGADFSTSLKGLNMGLRGEIAYRKPQGDYGTDVYIPNPDIYYVIGIDKELFMNFSILLQYIGRYVLDYTALEEPDESNDPSRYLIYELALKNRLISSQQYEISHSLFCRLGWRLLHETLVVELVGMTSITSEEFLIRPKIVYDIADAFSFTLGGELYIGPRDTLFGIIDSYMSSVFTELRISF